MTEQPDPTTPPDSVGDAPSGAPPEGPLGDDSAAPTIPPGWADDDPSTMPADLHVTLATPAPLTPFTPDAASSHAQALTAKYPSLTPRAVDPTEHNSNHALRVDDQADGWFAEISVDDDAHHTWLQEQIEAHLAAKKA